MSIGRFYAAIAALLWNPADGTYLVLKRTADKDFAGGAWECVTGRVDQGEGFTKAVHREVREELGIEVRIDFIGHPDQLGAYRASLDHGGGGGSAVSHRVLAWGVDTACRADPGAGSARAPTDLQGGIQGAGNSPFRAQPECMNLLR